MNTNNELEEGTLLKYIGKGFENFDKEQPLMKFLGYDSYGWKELWVEYNGQRIHVNTAEVEPVQ